MESPGTWAAQWLLQSSVQRWLLTVASKKLEGFRERFNLSLISDWISLCSWRFQTVSIHSNLCNFIITLISLPWDVQGGPPRLEVGL